DTAYSLYGEVMGEDQDPPFLIDKISANLGATISRPWGDRGSFWRLGAEFTDTVAARLAPATTTRPGVTYSNFIYRDGFTYRGRVLGHTVGGDGRLISLTGLFTDARNRSYRLSLRRAELNEFAATAISPSNNPETIGLVEGEVNMPTRWGDLQVELRVEDDAVNTPGRSPVKAAIEFGWRTRF
ncbi:MAG: hypothetical protein D6782_06185, partial [Alphaproteobacteria bacterium]